MKTFSILTLGCKVNSYESEALINKLIDEGYELKNFNEVCDIYIVNSCTVTKTSDQKSRQMLHAARRKNNNAVIVVMGCYSQLNEKEASTIADIVVGTNNKLDVVELIESYLTTKRQILKITDVLNNPTYEEMKVNVLKTHTRAFIKVQDGCENYCSYCAIPYSRGKIRSRRPDNVIEEIKYLVNSGTKEVILAGINTGTYGKDLGNINLASLIKRIMEETNLYRLRLSSIELMEITDELLNVLYKYKDRIANHLHIPCQGGSDTVLKRMNRKYTLIEYENRIKDIRKMFPDIALTTDILAGFVGETIDEFNETIEFIKRTKFYEMHVFPYSRRCNTVADTLEGHLEKSVITTRAKEISNLAEILKEEYINNYIGCEVYVLAEAKKKNYCHGHTSNYLDVYFESNQDLENKIVKVKIKSYDNKIILGEMEEVYE
ncbi:MAG: tRNA (N(6)-L-threonylcarbamoyladenosine(37)-C(2))-methylthiotransferase MtaB [Erysipelotrichaceae bacterium]|nr:tRNA (N(6)-L-threonylcarbamoyladenosine(37)-C(2))-methylthiotransferase MtaB [Erysipelotrichaceae bacterium]